MEFVYITTAPIGAAIVLRRKHLNIRVSPVEVRLRPDELLWFTQAASIDERPNRLLKT